MKNRKMKILYIAHEPKLGGATLCLITLVEEMKKKGHQVYVVVPFRNSPVAKTLKEKGITVKTIFFGWWMMPSYWNMVLKLIFIILYIFEFIPVLRIVHFIKKYNIDIVHSNSSAIDVGSRAANICKIPHVWHFREFGDLDYNLKFILGRKKSLTKVNSTKVIIIFISKSLRNYYQELKTNISVVYDGVASSYLNYSSPAFLGKKHITFLIAGNLQRNKGQKLVLEAALLLNKKGIKNFKILIAGGTASTGDSLKYAADLRKFIEINELRQAYMLGRMEDMNELRRESDVEIVASTMEAFGRVTVEAMLSGRPVLASDTGANSELVQDNITGWLFNSGDAKSLAGKMEEIINTPNNLFEMGKAAFESARSQYLSEYNTDNIESEYLKFF